jgi:alkanesulfonate monooxygenase SsuD/methylene tetrahydromethanopterin reductase-like flavin-dependent oxidoreductase (luciferase family)
MVLPLRHPIVAAMQIATASMVSGGRLIAGVGSGWLREEFDALGVPFSRRAARMEEAVAVMRLLWSGRSVAHDGEFYRFDELRLALQVEHEIPIWGGGASTTALRRAAVLFDGWASPILTLAQTRRVVAELTTLRTQSPRAERPFGLCVAVKDAYTFDHYAELAALGVDYLVTVPWMFYGAGYDSSLEEKCEGIRRFGRETIALMDD